MTVVSRFDWCGAVEPGAGKRRCTLLAGHVGDHEHRGVYGWTWSWPQSYNGPSPLDDVRPDEHGGER